MATIRPISIFVLITFATSGALSAQYLGKYIGKLSELHHGVSGEVYAVDAKTLYLKDFTYDGQGPAAYFYASSSKNANSAGFRLLDENGSPEVIRRYRKEGVTLTLPEGRTLNNIKIFYVWCEEFEVNFGDVKIPRNFDYPRPQKIETLKGVHGISSDNIVIVDAQTLLVPNLSYDGEAPDAKFWVGRGPKPSPQGIRVPDENGKEIPLRRYDRKTVVLTLPGDLTVFDIGHFGIWCEAFTVDFGHVQIPQTLNVPPSLKMLGVSPQSKLNCEVLYDDLAFEVRWAVAGDSIVLQLVAKLDEREYMSFGVSGDDTRNEMIGGDVVVAWVDKKTLKGFAEDYYLESKSQCSGPTGSCPDNRLKANSNNVRLLNAAMVNGYSIVTYQRPLKPSDEFDRQIHTNRSQAIIWAIGPLNQRDEVSFHSHYLRNDHFLNFGRTPKWNCPTPEGEQPPMRQVAAATTTTTTTTTTIRPRNSDRRRGSSSRTRKPVPTPAPVSKRNAWEIPPIQCYEPEDGVFYAQMGPTGGKHGYPAITGHVGWGISWYINGLLIPEINVVRGKTYTFVVEGGFDPEVPAKYHPFYITDDSVGGYEYKTEEEKQSIRIFAGAITSKDGSVKPTGTGRLCHWTQQGEAEADDFDSFGAYQRSLELKCDQGEPGVIQWTPDKNTPDTVYYQCFTHRYLGWKINVLDSCDVQQPSGSAPQPVIVPAPEDLDLEESPSILVETRVKPNDLHVDKDDKPSQLSATLDDYNRDVSQQLKDFIPSPIVNVELTQVTTPKLQEKNIVAHNNFTLFNKPRPALRLKPVKVMRVPAPPPFRRPPAKTKIIYNKKPMMQRMPQRPPMKRPQAPPPFIVVKPVALTTSTPNPPQVLVSHVEISPVHNKDEFLNMKPAENTGFHPESVKIEGGFTPMLSTKQEFAAERISEPELEYESEIGVIDHEMSPYFEPVFVPSPVDKRNKQKHHKRGYIKKIIVKRPRSLEDQEPESAAAERVDSYYLPPQGILPKNAQPQQRSDIDLEAPIDSPPDVVVTYDGRKVSGASLTARFGADRSVLQRGSKAEELIKARPQFAPFKGELPPLDPHILHKNVANAGVINRELDTPPVVTKLRAVRQKRSPHHTPEHTAEQQRSTNATDDIAGAGNPINSSIVSPLLAICLLFKYFVD